MKTLACSIVLAALIIALTWILTSLHTGYWQERGGNSLCYYRLNVLTGRVTEYYIFAEQAAAGIRRYDIDK